MGKYAYDLGAKVKLAMSGEKGVVVGRAEYSENPPSYWVRYVAANGQQREGWFNAEALAADEAEG